MEILEIVFPLMTLIMLAISIFDIETATIPHTLTILLLILGIVFCIFDKDTNYFLTFLAFGCMFLFQFLLFCIYGENAIGGGDVKILSISMLFLHNASYLMNYCLFLSAFSIFGYIVVKTKKETHLRYGPYMALSLITTIMFMSNVGICEIMIYDLLLISIMILVDVLFFTKRRVMDYAFKTKEVIKK